MKFLPCWKLAFFGCSFVPKGREGSALGELVTELQLACMHAGHTTCVQATGSFLFAKWSVSQLSASWSSHSLQREGGVWQPQWVTGLTWQVPVTYRFLLQS